MPLVKFDRVVSCSSEDPNHPAKNLLKTETYKKWKCKSPGEDQISVVLQLEKLALINAVDVGNEHSAFVEVLVGRSSGDAEDFKVLLVASSFMTPLEARNGDNPNRVRMFNADQLSKPTVNERWDRVKVVCRQPFNRHVQYGISFLKLHTSSEELSDQPASKKEQQHQTKIGRFVVREEEPDDDIKVGSLFAVKHGATVGGLLGGPQKPPPSTGAAAIMDASKPAALASFEPSKKKQSPAQRNHKETPSLQRSDILIKTTVKDNQRESKDSKGTYGNGIANNHRATEKTKDKDDAEHSPSPKRMKVKDISRSVAAASMPKNKTNETLAAGGDRLLPEKQKAGPSNIRKKPRAEVTFSKLLDKVVLVISGYQNPLRANLRQAALDMGAKYRPDWGPGCTHLVCAFPNTPKFNQVKGHGKIVRKEWVEDCHSQRKRLPWRRYAMDKKDQIGPESDTEDDTDSVASANDERNSPPASPSHSDDYGDVRTRMSQTDVKRRPSLFAPLSDDRDEGKRTPSHDRQMPATSCHSPNSYYDADTDVDEDADLPSDGDLPPLPQLPNFFRSLKFRLGPSLSEGMASKLQRYITAYGGETVDAVANADYLVTDKIKDCEKIKFDRNKCVAVRPAWIWECNDNRKLVPASNFELE